MFALLGKRFDIASSVFFVICCLFFAALPASGQSADLVCEPDTYGNERVCYSYDKFGRLDQVRYSHTDLTYKYTYDDAGNRTAVYTYMGGSFPVLRLWNGSGTEAQGYVYLDMWFTGGLKETTEIVLSRRTAAEVGNTEGNEAACYGDSGCDDDFDLSAAQVWDTEADSVSSQHSLSVSTDTLTLTAHPSGSDATKNFRTTIRIPVNLDAETEALESFFFAVDSVSTGSLDESVRYVANGDPVVTDYYSQARLNIDAGGAVSLTCSALLDVTATSEDLTVAADGLTVTYERVGDRNAIPATTTIDSGKWYWEIEVLEDTTGSSQIRIGVIANTGIDWDAQFRNQPDTVYYSEDGSVTYVDASGTRTDISTSTPSISVGSVVGIAFDMDSGAIWVSADGVWVNGATQAEIEAGDTSNAVATGLSGTYVPVATGNSGSNGHVTKYNFGGSSFSHSVPNGYECSSGSGVSQPIVSLASAGDVNESGTLNFNLSLNSAPTNGGIVGFMVSGEGITADDFDSTSAQTFPYFDVELYPGVMNGYSLPLVTVDDGDDTELSETLAVEIIDAIGVDVSLVNYSATGNIWDPGYTPYTLVTEATVFTPETDTGQIFLVPSGSTATISLAGGAGGGDSEGGEGGMGAFTLAPTNDLYLRFRIGKEGLDDSTYQTELADINGAGAGGSGEAGQGGGATAMLMSSDGLNWTHVAIVGGGGGHGSNNDRGKVGGAGGGLNRDGLDGAGTAANTGLGATTTSVGQGQDGGGDGGAPGEDAVYSSDNNNKGIPGSGDALFMIGGGGHGSSGSSGSGGGGGGYYGGGGAGGSCCAGGGGSGYYDPFSIQTLAGVTPSKENLPDQGGWSGDGAVYISFDGSTLEAGGTLPDVGSGDGPGDNPDDGSGSGDDPGEPAILFTVSDANATEGDPITFNVVKTGTTTETFTLDYATSHVTAEDGDYVPQSGTLTFGPSDDSLPIPVPTAIDEDLDDETFRLTLSNLSGGGGFAAGGDVAFGSIEEDLDDTGQPGPKFTVSDPEVTEGGVLYFTVGKTADSPDSDPTIKHTVVYETVSGSAESTDYYYKTGTVELFGDERGEYVEVTTLVDADMDDEVVYLQLSNASGNSSIAKSLGIGTILDEVSTVPSFSVTDVSTTEGGTLSFKVQKTGTASETYYVDYETNDNGSAESGDFVATSGTLTFGATRDEWTVNVTTNQDTDYNDEVVYLDISNATGGATISNSRGSGTVYDDDVPPSFSVANESTGEGGTLTFTIRKNGTATKSHDITYTTSRSGGTAESSDFDSETGTHTFSTSQSTFDVTVNTHEDADEDDDTMFLVLSNATGGATISDSKGKGTIVDNGGAAETPPSFAVSNASTTEGGTLSFEVTKTGTVSSSYDVDYTTSSSGSAESSDFTAKSGTLTFSSSQTSRTVTVNTNEDADFDDDVMYLNLSNASDGATITDSQGAGTINDLGQPSFTISADQGGSVAESNGSVTITVTLSTSSSLSHSVSYATSNVSATAGSDYTAKSGTLTWAAGTSGAKTFTVSILNNQTPESYETFKVQLSNATNGAAIATSSVTIGIEDDDGIIE